ncbi:Mrp/NBP35 family ATP-binding protein [Alphaproteobacteria bacterium]|nr:Mrp/NBP35 family ATP-binding protein [Alphaproteobacteria bacterium]MDA8624325.1 Mrp/NBP35 family ATP-binding protein [Alphaproteobacteria bacterium]MDA8624754.1 Mrp/NBP35 family ATP-binding protein [Alphaproteobacteria bacterium]MDA9590568.1 Mrp/NBP35 family ATP-binding protein [Alphaproteobacteria bacterium]MDB2406249.1 Mrp/NBP35 family ATP-binding protein [Alphaproteobacteria bacterium]
MSAPTAKLTQAEILTALDAITAAGEAQSLVAADRIQGLVIRDGNIGFSIDVDGLAPDGLDALKQQAEAAVQQLSGVVSVTCVLTAHRPQQATANKAPHNSASTEVPEVFKRIKTVIAVASGKGGVGKSTVAVNLAAALAKAGNVTGLLDADIYGPSMPQLLGITDKPQMTDDNKLLPIEANGMLTMSIGYLVDTDQAMIWRGPMAQGALVQMLEDVAWPALDVLVLDLPPGTGDIQLTMAQRIPVSGAVLVTTPSDLALADVTRAIAMFEKTNVPVLGLIENMAYLDAPDGTRLYPFGEGGEKMAKKLELAHLAGLPLDAAIGTKGAHEAFQKLAARISKSIKET